MNEKYRNKPQKMMIDLCLNKKLTNNDLHIKNIVYEFLSSKCNHCEKIIVNPLYINSNPVCMDCINKYIYCCKTGCKELSYKPKKRCRRCYGWYCNLHYKRVCRCRD